MAGTACGVGGLGGDEKASGLNGGNFTSGGESDVEGREGEVFGEFGDGENVVGTQREENRFNPAAQGFNGRTEGGEAVFRILKNARPSGRGKADLVTK